MKYKYGVRRRAGEYEKALIEFWKKDKTFEKSVEMRSAENGYVFYDGPPFITGNPHHGTLLSSVVKDAVPRFWTMRGKRVERVWGWDCHGLPAENFTEKHLGGTVSRVAGGDASELELKIGDRVESISLEKYIETARELMVANSATWESTIDRIGRWVDFKGAYKTMDKNFMESVWWAFKELYEKGLIYEGEKVLMYDTTFATPVSKNEVTMDNDAYQTVTDPSAYVKFEKKREIKNDRIIKIVKSLGFPLDEVLVFASGIMDVYGLKDSDDIDLVVSKKVFNEIKNSGEWVGKHKEAVGKTMYSKVVDGIEIETSGDFDWVDWCDKEVGFESLIRRAEKIDGVYFNDFADLLAWKKKMNREKDQNDIELIEKFLSEKTYLLAWTTTPWTLPGNMALAVNPELEYVEVEVDGERLVLAESLTEKVLSDDKGKKMEFSVVEHFHGKDLVGLKYRDLLGGDEHEVFGAEWVEDGGGTGIVHVAPAYGEDDFALAKKEGISVKHVIDDNGYYLPETAEILHGLGVRDIDERGIEVWAANKFIAKCILEAGKIWKIEYIKHEYPFNPRSKQRIMYRAIPSWFFDVQGQKPLMLEKNEGVNWFPEYLKNGRFAKNIEQAPDWNLSRDRFWATAMPVWKGDKGTVKVVGSYEELYELSGVKLEDYHRPWVDEITFEIDGEKFTRVDKVLDCWFESGSMPFAQLHYPFENKEKFEKNYPADFIVEYIGQVRAWFYYVHVLNTALFGDMAYKNVITTGTLAGNDGRKMSKSLGNYTDPNELMDKFSADALRFLMLSSPVLSGEDFALLDKDVSDVARKLSMIWNVYDFFTMYAEVDGWESNSDSSENLSGGTPVFTGRRPSQSAGNRGELAPLPQSLQNPNLDSLVNPLDKWIVSRVYQLRNEVTAGMEGYNLPEALAGVLPFVDDLSNWFVRRSRRRFWKSEDDNDKAEAYRTLHFVLSYLALVLAPFVPFLAEELWQNMVGGESVHLQDWPAAGEIDEQTLSKMFTAREIITEGLAQRMNKSETEEQIKVRQPLSELKYGGEKLDEFYESIIADEVNVKKVVHGGDGIVLNKTLNDELRAEGFARELIRFVQAARKKAGLSVDDRIKLNISEDVLGEYEDMVRDEVLATEITRGENYGYDEIVKVEGKSVTISLEKA